MTMTPRPRSTGSWQEPPTRPLAGGGGIDVPFAQRYTLPELAAPSATTRPFPQALNALREARDRGDVEGFLRVSAEITRVAIRNVDTYSQEEKDVWKSMNDSGVMQSYLETAMKGQGGVLTAAQSAELDMQRQQLEENRRQFGVTSQFRLQQLGQEQQQFGVTSDLQRQRLGQEQQQFDTTQEFRLQQERQQLESMLLEQRQKAAQFSQQLQAQLAPYAMPQGMEYSPGFEPEGAMNRLAQLGGWDYNPTPNQYTTVDTGAMPQQTEQNIALLLSRLAGG